MSAYSWSGGCCIDKVPLPGTDCKCNYFACNCGESVAQYQDFLDYYCIYSDTSRNTCLQGGGDCGGYRRLK